MALAAQFVHLTPSTTNAGRAASSMQATTRAPLKTYENYCLLSNAVHSAGQNTNYLLPFRVRECGEDCVAIRK